MIDRVPELFHTGPVRSLSRLGIIFISGATMALHRVSGFITDLAVATACESLEGQDRDSRGLSGCRYRMAAVAYLISERVQEQA